MTQQQLFDEIKRLSLDERMELLEAISRSVREEIQTREGGGSSADQVRGLLKPDGELPPDAELADAYTRHLLEKYA